MTESLFQKFGAFELPADETLTADGLPAALDPGRAVLLGLFKQALLSELTAAWNVARVGTVLSAAPVVNSTWPFMPSPQVMRELRTEFPMLAVYRSGEATYAEHTLAIEKLTQPWTVDYVLGPLGVEDVRRLGDVLSAIPKVLGLCIRRRGHPDYASGALQFGDDEGRFASVALTGYELGPAASAGPDSPLYYAASVKLVTEELDGYRDGFATDLLGASFSTDVGGNDGLYPDLIGADTDSPLQ